MPHIQVTIAGYAPFKPKRGILAKFFWWLEWRNGPFAPHGVTCHICRPYLLGKSEIN